MSAEPNEKEHDQLLYQNFRWLSESYWNCMDAGIGDLAMLVLDFRSPLGRRLAEQLVSVETVGRITEATPSELIPSLVWGGARLDALSAVRTAFSSELQTSWPHFMEVRLSDPTEDGKHLRFVLSQRQISCCRPDWPSRRDDNPPEGQASV